jgi:flagellar biosynthesis protein FlhA
MQPKPSRSTRWSTVAASAWLPAAVLSAVLVVLSPMPAWWIDMLLAANLAVSAVALAAVVSARSPLELSLFPTFLLAATLVRLVLNISTTRLILTRAAAEGDTAAGEVVRAFGQFVSGESLVVGGVIFGVIAIVQLVVITAGATRIGEVAARFTLDAIPGRQASIDSELQAGSITAEEARRQRKDLARQADFYASMDGAGRFVRGEAVAGMAIIVVNLVGGMLVGVVQQGMPLPRALEVYSTLTIGDGLVGAVPALLISVATGLLITRSTEPVDLARALPAQFAGRGPVLLAAAAFLAVMALTGFPAVPLVTLAAGLGLLATRPSRRQGGDPRTDDDGFPQASSSTEASDRTTRSDGDAFARISREEGLRVTIGRGLLHGIAAPGRRPILPERVALLRERLAEELGLPLPAVTFDTDAAAPTTGWRVRLAGEMLGQGEIVEGRLLALPAAGCLLGIDGIDAVDPLTGRRAVWIAPHQAARVIREGGSTSEPLDVVARGIEAAVRRHAPALLSRESASRLVEGLRQAQPTLVDGVVPDRVPLAVVHRTLQSLLAEGMPLVPLAPLFELLADHAREADDPSELAERLRIGLSRRLRSRLRSPEGRLTVIRLAGEPLVVLSGPGRQAPPMLANQIRRASRPLLERGRLPVIVVPQASRRAVRDALVSVLPEVTVLSEEEAAEERHLETFATLGDESMEIAADRPRAA